MFAYIVRRLVYGVVTLFALSFIVFTLMQSTGGGPLDRLKLNPRNTQEFITQQTEFYGLDQPFLAQYWKWLRNFVTPTEFAIKNVALFAAGLLVVTLSHKQFGK